MGRPILLGHTRRYSRSVYPDKLVLITLLIQLGVAAAVSAALARSRVFKELLFAHRRSAAQIAGLLAFLCIPLTLGVWVRVTVPNFLAADIAFETVILIALMLGTLPATVAAAVLSIPALAHHEYLTLPFNVAVAAVFGLYREFVSDADVWSFSPFVDLSLYRWVRRTLRTPRVDRQILLLLLIMLMQLARTWLAHLYPGRLFTVDSSNWWIKLAVYATPAMVVGIPLKIWHAQRLEQQLEEQAKSLMEARMEALQRQIHPHFLFNTLNSIASLVRFQPDTAREMIVKLGNILRVLLQESEAFVHLRDELDFTDDYLDIEVVRFGEKLRVEKDIDPATLDLLLPSMVLQPVIENSIKHGLEPRISGGTITLRSRLRDGVLVVQIEDDGIGMSADVDVTAPSTAGGGIGLKNVRERLHVLFGDAARLEVVSRPGRGTRVSIEIPQTALASADHHERASTSA
jgi:two-component system LytT family sensor kinase